MRQIQEPVLIQAFIAQASVERLDIGILVRLAGFDQTQDHAMLMCPGQHRPPAELLSIIGANNARQTAGLRQLVEDAGDAQAADCMFRPDRH